MRIEKVHDTMNIFLRIKMYILKSSHANKTKKVMWFINNEYLLI